MARATTISALFAALFAGLVHAQRTNTTCQATYSWMKNAQGQDPCLLASYLSMPCAGSQGPWNSQPLTPDQYYLSPTTSNANPCLCSAVFYSVVSACAYCQGATVSTWFQWIPSCSTYQSNTYPGTVVSGSSIPGWATLPIPASGAWDATAAYNYALSASASITLGGSTTAGPATSASGSGAVALPSLSRSSSAPASTQTSSSNNSGVIGAAIGGTIGGLGLLAGIGFCIWYFCLRKPSGEHNIKHNGGLDDEGKTNSPPIQVQPWNPDASAPGSQPGSYYNAPTPAPQPMSPPPLSSITYASPQTFAPQPSQYSGPGSDIGGPTTYSESNSGYGAAPVTVTYGVANPGPTMQYPAHDPSQYSSHDPNQYSSAATSYNNTGYSNPTAAYQQPTSGNPLLEGFDGGMHAPPPRYETPAPGPSMMGPGATGATGWPNEKR